MLDMQYTFDRQIDRQILYCLNNIFINKIYIDKKGTEIQCGMDFCALLLYFTEKLWARRLMERDHQNTEYILLDTPMQEVSGYMRYKPAGWLKSDEVNREKIVETLQACIYHLHRNRDECFCLHTKAKTVRIPYRQILYLESRLHRVVVHTVREKDVCAFAAVLDDVANVLPEESFFRCHQSFLVNIDSIYQLDRTNRNLILSNGETLGISKRYYKEINRIFSCEATI